MATDLRKLRDELLAESFGDVAPAQQAAAESASRANWGRIGSNLAGAIGGFKADTSAMDAIEQRGQQGVQDALRMATAKQSAMGEARQVQAAEQDAARQAAEDDPNSPEAQALVQFYEQFAQGSGEKLKGLGYKKLHGMYPAVSKLYEQRLEAERAAAKRDQELADLKEKRTYDEQQAEVKFGRDKQLAGIRAQAGVDAANSKQPTVPAGEAAAIGGLDAADSMITRLDKDWERLASGFGSSATQFVPGTDAAQYADKKLAAAQAIGTVLEEGKLTDSDLKDKYLKLVPDPTDSPQRKAEKINELRLIAQEKKAAKVKALGQAGYKTQGFEQAAPAPAPQGGEVDVIGPNGEEGTMSEAELKEWGPKGWRKARP